MLFFPAAYGRWLGFQLKRHSIFLRSPADFSCFSSNDRGCLLSRKSTMASLLGDEWRGLAHFRTESRRRVFKKTPSERTPSELYVLEEVFSDVKLINNLPFSKRLEICKLIHYEDVEENKVVYKEGDVGSMFYVIFTGSVKVTATFGRKQKLLNTLYAGDSFGESAFLQEHNFRKESVTTLRRCELLTLNKADYERILKTDITEAVRANVDALMKVEALRSIPQAGLYRLASFVTPRMFAKNKVITFQGEEPREMFFIKSGECRVVMEVRLPAETSNRELPRAATSLSQYRPTTHDHCKKAVEETQKDWGHPHFVSRPYSCQSLRSHSVPPVVFTSLTSASAEAADTRPVSAPQPTPKDPEYVQLDTGPALRLTPKQKRRSQTSDTTCATENKEQPGSGEREVQQDSILTQQKSGRQSQVIHPRQRGVLPKLPNFLKQQQEEQAKREKEENARALAKVLRRSRPFSQMSFRSYKAKRIKSIAAKESITYSLNSLLKEIDQKFSDESIQDLDFSDKEALLWGMGTCDTGLQRGDISDVGHYRGKFEEWARKVISREKKLLQEEFTDSELPSFRSIDCCSSGNKTGPGDKPPLQDRLLDVGGLHEGEFFGELGLLSKNKRAASILTVTEVEVLVLTNSDFCRRLDKDIIDCLSSNRYKKLQYIEEQFYRTHRWEAFKKRMIKDMLMQKKERFPNRFHHDMTEASRRKGSGVRSLS